MDGELTKERVEAMLRPFENSDSATERVSVKLSLAEFKSLANAALLALRQQDGDVLARHSEETTLREWHTASAYLYPGDAIVVLAASGQDQPKDAAGQVMAGHQGRAPASPVDAPLPASAAAPDSLRILWPDRSETIDQPSGPHDQEAVGKVIAEVRRRQNEELESAIQAARMEGIALGIEAAAIAVDQCNRMGPYAAIGAASRIRSLNPSDIAATAEKNPGAGQELPARPEARVAADGGTQSASTPPYVPVLADTEVNAKGEYKGATQQPAQPTGADWQAARERVTGKVRSHIVVCKEIYDAFTRWSVFDGDVFLGSGPDEPAAWLDADRRM